MSRAWVGRPAVAENGGRDFVEGLAGLRGPVAGPIGQVGQTVIMEIPWATEGIGKGFPIC